MRFIPILFMLLLISSCATKGKKTEAEQNTLKQEYLIKGEEIAKLTQAELLKNVSAAMGTGGPVYAIEFCNLQALSLKDSLSRLYNCEIRRLSEKYRNPADKPETETEIYQLTHYLEKHQKGESLKPEVHIFDDRVEYYQAILVNNAACLLCHGEPESQIAIETLDVIGTRYPRDLATGFALNDFRGVWKISFQK